MRFPLLYAYRSRKANEKVRCRKAPDENLKCHFHKQRYEAEDHGAEYIGIPAHAVPQRAVGLGSTLVDLCQQIIFLHHPEPGNGTQGGTDGDDIDGNNIHPGAPFENGFHVQTEAQTNHTQYHQYKIAADSGEAVLQRFAHSFKHILQGADTGKYHGGVENDSEELTQGHILQNPGQGHKQQGRACADVQTVGKAGGDDHQCGNQSGDGVEDGSTDGNVDYIFLIIQISAVNDHTAAGDGEGEKGLSHSPDPYHGIFQFGPVGGEHEFVACGSAGKK